MGPPLVIFVAMPGTDMGLHATWRDTAEIKQYLYEPVAEQVKSALGREVDLRIEKDKISQGVIHRSMFNEALRADVYIADLTGANPNVYLELGVRWALRDRVTLLVCQNEDHDIKFNVFPSRFIHYGPKPLELESACEKMVRAILKGVADGSDDATDSLVREYLDKNELQLGNAGMQSEPTGRHALGGRLLRYFRTHTWTLVDRKKFRRRRTVSTSVIGYLGLAITALLLGAFLGTSYSGTEDSSRVPLERSHEIGDAYPSPGEEFLVQFVNQSSGKCIARNGVETHPTDSEIPGPGRNGADIYQYSCSTGLVFPQALVLVPLKNDSWIIRSSVKSNLCLQSDGKPSTDQHLQICDEDDDRQRWILQSVLNANSSQIALVRNRHTDLCLVHGGSPGGDPAHPVETITQRQCLPEPRAEWLIRKLPPVGVRECLDRPNVGIKNQETGLYVNHGDQDRPLMGNREKMTSLVPAGQSAHGCTVQIVGPAKNCIEVPMEGTPDGEALWMPCNNGRSGQRWLIQSLGKLDGQNRLLFHPIYDTSRCLRQSDKNVKAATLTAPRCQGGWLPQWVVEE